MEYKEVIKKINSLENPKNVLGMARFGIRPKTKIMGVPVPELRRMAKIIKINHNLALKLWDSKIHEARLLATMIADSEKLTASEINKWVQDFDSWDICDQACMNLFSRSKSAIKQIYKFYKSKKEFTKRTAFALMAALAVHAKDFKDKDFIKFFPLIKKASTDERNFVKKSVNWAIRQIGKRNLKLNKEAIKLSKEIIKMKSKSAKWIASGALKELNSKEVYNRLNK